MRIQLLTIGVFSLWAVLSGSARGGEWRQIGPAGSKVNTVEVSEAKVFLGSDDGVSEFLLPDFISFPPGGAYGKKVISLLPLDSDTLLVGVLDDPSPLYYYVSGSGWRTLPNDYGGGSFQPAFSLGRLADGSGSLLATGVAVVAKSDNGGANWRVVWGDWSWLAMGVVFVQPDPYRPNVVWAGGEAAIFAPWLLKSTDYGESFELLPVYGGGDNRCHDVVVHPDIADIAWVSMEGLVRKTTDGGQTWFDVLSNEYYLYALEIDPRQPTRIYCTGARYDERLTLFYTRDGGDTWDISVDSTYEQNAAYDMTLVQRNSGCQLMLATDHSLFLYEDEYIPCCHGRVGDVNGEGGDEPTISDISLLIDVLFISQDPGKISCLGEADVNQSGGVYLYEGDLTISDVAVLIDYLFITGPSLVLPECL